MAVGGQSGPSPRARAGVMAGVDGLGPDARSDMAETCSGVTVGIPGGFTSATMAEPLPTAAPGRNASPITPPKSRLMSTPCLPKSNLPRAVSMRAELPRSDSWPSSRCRSSSARAWTVG